MAQRLRRALSGLIALAVLALEVVPSARAAEELSQDMICKAAIAAIMGRNPRIIQVSRRSDEAVFLSYVRSDNTEWAYRCKLFENQVVWASDPGRWRDHPADVQILLETSVDGGSLTIVQKFSDGSKLEDEFSREQA